jgi:phosphate starvation-inducible PhoH-like protein
MVFGTAPRAGKTYLAVAPLSPAREIRRAHRARAAGGGSGEKLASARRPQDKVDPTRPLYDALYDLLDYERVSRLLERNAIEVAPIAFMRGRTLNDAFVIIDEAQNTTTEQMKMVLTRIGFGSKVVITGDITQIDLPAGRTSGLVEAIAVLNGVKGISFVYFDEKDVVRHKLVQSVIKACDAYGVAGTLRPGGAKGVGAISGPPQPATPSAEFRRRLRRVIQTRDARCASGEVASS